MVEKLCSPVYLQLQAYEEAWKNDHSEAMACRDWEDAIAVGINIFQMLCDREQAWRDQVFNGVIPFATEDDLDHQCRFKNWLNTTKECLAEIVPGLENRFVTVKGASQLRELAAFAEKIIGCWQAPRLSMSKGLAEMTLSDQAAVELDRILRQAKQIAPPRMNSKMTIKDASLLVS